MTDFAELFAYYPADRRTIPRGHAQEAGRPGPGRGRRRRRQRLPGLPPGRRRLHPQGPHPGRPGGRGAPTCRCAGEAPGGARDGDQALLRRRPCSPARPSTSRAVQEIVRRAGESAVVAGSPRKLRLHVHTDDAAALVLRAPEARRHPGHQGRRHAPAVRGRPRAQSAGSPSSPIRPATCPGAVVDDHQVHVVPVQPLLRRQPRSSTR
ncbi:MAG: hypothetical protein M0C28_32280 [Candidatus Moduliflexus flocculans]|nr:hypothetical protein [Candidatus Moduliflexus flocculans]